MTDQDVTDALQEHPELEGLRLLRDAGWWFVPAADEMDQMLGFRRWRDGWMDAIRLRGPNDVLGWRITPGEPPAAVWEKAGGLTEVVAALLDLPAPGEPGAPRLIRGAAPRLWLPRDVGRLGA